MPRLDSFFLTLPGFHVISKSNVQALYSIKVLKDILNKITLFFLPIFLFLFGPKVPYMDRFNLTDLQLGMVLIAVFFAMSRIVVFLTAIPIGTLVMKLQFETAVLISFILRIASFTSLYFSTQYPVLLLAAAILEGIQSNFFWNGFFTILTKSISEKPTGKEYTISQFLFQLISVLIPAISGYLAYHYGLEVLFLLGIVISLISAVMVTKINIRLPYDEVSWKEFRTWLKNPTFIKAAGSFAGRYINDTALFLWPLYMFLLLGTVERVGFLYTFSLFIALLIVFFIGGYVNKVTEKKVPFFLSGGALSLVWLARTQIFSVWGMAAADTIERLFSNFHWLFYDVLFIKRGKGAQAFSYFVYRELLVSVVALLFWLLFAGLFMITDSWTAVFIFGGIGVALSVLISNYTDEKKSATGLRL